MFELTHLGDISEGSRVLVHGSHGSVKFIGNTEFAPGKWIGIELEVPKGKNNGTVGGVKYFDCRGPGDDGIYGLFVRPSAIEKVLDSPLDHARSNGSNDSNTEVRRNSVDGSQGSTEPPLTPSKRSTKLSMNLRSASRVASDAGGAMVIPPLRLSSSLAYPATRSPTRTASGLASSMGSPTRSSSRRDGSLRSDSGSFFGTGGEEHDDTQTLVREIETLKSKLKLMEKKRLEDREKIKAFQSDSQRVLTYENVVQRLQLKLKSSLDELQCLRQQLKDLQHQGSSSVGEEELEMATLDKEMAEERAESLLLEVTALRTKVEQLSLDCEILKEENSLMSSDSTTADGNTEASSLLSLQKRNERLEVALLKLRELSISQEQSYKDQINTLEKQNQDLKVAENSLSSVKKQLDDAEAVIEDLRAQLDNALGAEDMIESLTEKNLELNEQCVELKNTIEELETLKELNDELEENHKLREEQLTLDLKELESTNIDNQNRLTKVQRHNEYLEQAIAKYQALVGALDRQLVELKEAKKQSVEGLDQSITSEDSFDNLRAATLQSDASLIDYELKCLEHQQSLRQLEITKGYLVADFYVDEDAISFYLQLEKIKFHLNLLLSQFVVRLPAGVSICIILNDLLSEVAVLVDYFKYCPKENFRADAAMKETFSAVEEWLDFEVGVLRNGDTKESEMLKSLELTLNRASKASENLTTLPVCQTSELLRYCSQLVDILTKPPSLGDKFPEANKFLQDVRANTSRLLKDLSTSDKPVRNERNKKKPNCLGSGEITFMTQLRAFLRELSRLAIELIIDPEDQDNGAATNAKIAECTQNIFAVSCDSVEDLSEYLSKRFASFKTLSKVQLTERRSLAATSWKAKALDLDQARNEQEDLNKKIALLNEELGALALDNRNKVRLVDELKTNLEVTNAKLLKSKDQVKLISDLKKQLAQSHVKEQYLMDEVSNLKVNMQKYEDKLDKYKAIDIFSLSTSEILATRMPKVALMGQVESLKAAVIFLSSSRASELKEKAYMLANLDAILQTRYNMPHAHHSLYNDIRHAAATYKQIDLSLSSSKWRPKSKRPSLQYLSQVKRLEEINSSLTSIINKE